MNINHTTKMIIGGVAIAAVFFFAGSAFAKHKTKSVNPEMGMMQGGRGNFTGGNMRIGASASGGFVSGTVLSKTDITITVQNQAGGSKILLVSPQTAVSKSAQGSITDVAVGSSILATGSTNSDGSITAQTLQLRPEGSQDRR